MNLHTICCQPHLQEKRSSTFGKRSSSNDLKVSKLNHFINHRDSMLKSMP
uniref:Uncharacterized protein n=1 Tax=Arundo donax TaxID=35708 RepID=A0A0A9EJG4_ARUDO